MSSQHYHIHPLPYPTMKSREQIRNRYDFLTERKKAVANTASHFSTGKGDPALALQLLTLDVRQAELLWVLDQKPTFDA